MYETGDDSISGLAELLSISRQAFRPGAKAA